MKLPKLAPSPARAIASRKRRSPPTKTRKAANQTNLRPPGPRAKARSSAPARFISEPKPLDWKTRNDMNSLPQSGRF